MSQLFLFCTLLFLLIAFLFSNIYIAKKQVSYKNDERWNIILNKASIAPTTFLKFVFGVFFISWIVISVFQIQLNIGVDAIFLLVLVIISIESMLKTLVVKIYDTKI